MRGHPHVLLLCTIGLLAGCMVSPDASSPAADAITAPPNVEECQAKGGAVRNVCRLQFPACVVPYSDGGKRCTDSAQCKGKCLMDTDADVEFEPGDRAEGICQQDNDPCGCKIEVAKGKVKGGVCVD
jgi:putative hemolysin